MTQEPQPEGQVADLSRRLERFDQALQQMAVSRAFARPAKLPRLLDAARLLLADPEGCALIEERAQAIEEAGVFAGTDWADPAILLPGLSQSALRSTDSRTLMIEVLSELRLLAIARGRFLHSSLSAEQAHHYLTQVLAVNLELLFGIGGEAEREQGRLARLVHNLLLYLAEHIGYEHIIDGLIEEIWRILDQRPIQVAPVSQMITQIALCRNDTQVDLGNAGQGAERLISSLYGPTRACREDPGVALYRERLRAMDELALQTEASGFARSMHDTGLVSPYHACFLRFVQDRDPGLLVEALGLSSTGRDCLLCYQQLVRALIDVGIQPATAQGIYGLALMLERGILYQPPVAPALWRQTHLALSSAATERLELAFGTELPPRAWLVQGVLSILGQPLGVGQGSNPTCQSARALSMWAYNDPDYLLQMVAWAARDDEVIMHFEGQCISSHAAGAGVAASVGLDLDPVSLVVVPHLDRIYAEMGRRCAQREGDPHQWVNPEFHGWWCGRGFRINLDVASGQLHELEEFLRYFYASYHPFYNGNQPLIHPQPAGVAVTDSAARFIGWHAISILRVALDPTEVMRVYFFNPNNDSGQNWGDEVVVSTFGHGERFGEASLPFEQFASRLYIFHYDPLEPGTPADVHRAELKRVIERVHRSWGQGRLATEDPLQAESDPST